LWFEASPGKVSETPILKNPLQKKKAGGVAQDVGPEFKTQYHPKKKRFWLNGKK
jgi:hypothetical protein